MRDMKDIAVLLVIGRIDVSYSSGFHIPHCDIVEGREICVQAVVSAISGKKYQI